VPPQPKKKTFSVSLEHKKPRGSGHERRQEILAAARLLFQQEGVEAISTRRIAKSVGLSQTSIYVYFENKEAILNALIDAAFGGLKALLEEIEQRSAGPFEYLREALPAYIRFGLAHPDEYRLAFMLLDPVRSDSGPEGWRSGFGLHVFAGLEAQVARAIELGLISDQGFTARVLAQSIWAGIHGLVAVRLVFPGFGWPDTEQQIALHTRLLLAGLGPVRAKIERL